VDETEGGSGGGAGINADDFKEDSAAPLELRVREGNSPECDDDDVDEARLITMWSFVFLLVALGTALTSSLLTPL
jgi:hypothetical protein